MSDVFCFLLLGVTLGVQEVGKEKQFDDDKKDKQLDAYDKPQGFADGHLTEAVIIQVKHP